MVAVGEAARERGTAVVLAVDELQYVPEEQLAALISALHRASQRQLPVTLVAAGLPQLLGQMGRAKSYAERLFEFVPVGPLDAEAAATAIRVPVEGEAIEPEAVHAIVRGTQGYPYFLQEWGKHAWDAADASPIDEADVEAAAVTAVAELDASFFRVRFDRLTPAEKRYLRAMASLGPGPHRSGDIANALGVKVTSVAPTRNSLIAKGMLFSPRARRHGLHGAAVRRLHAPRHAKGVARRVGSRSASKPPADWRETQAIYLARPRTCDPALVRWTRSGRHALHGGR